MKTTTECYRALINGEKLCRAGGTEKYIQLDSDDKTVDELGVFKNLAFLYPDEWSIYTPPKWYDNIPEHGVLCWVWDNNKVVKKMAFIDRYDHYSEFPFRNNNNIGYRNAAPLTKQEIQALLDNAPDGEDQ